MKIDLKVEGLKYTSSSILETDKNNKLQTCVFFNDECNSTGNSKNTFIKRKLLLSQIVQVCINLSTQTAYQNEKYKTFFIFSNFDCSVTM